MDIIPRQPFAIIAVSYGAAAAAYGALAVLLLTRWRGRLAGSLLVPAVLVSSIWLAVIVTYSLGVDVPPSVVLGLEVARDSAWLMFLLRMFSVGGSSLSRWPRYAVYAACALAFIAVGVGGVLHDFANIEGTALEFYVPAVLALSIGAFVLVDHGYRNTRAGDEWAAKFLWLALGAQFVYDMFLYAAALMFAGLPDVLWEARGAALALLVPVLAVGVARIGAQSPGQFLSLRLVFYSTGVMAAGAYLLAVALGGYYLRVVGGTWGGFAQTVFLFGAMLLLAVLLASGRARAWLRVFVAKHMSAYKHDYRAEWLRLVRTMVAPGDERSLADRAIEAM